MCRDFDVFDLDMFNRRNGLRAFPTEAERRPHSPRGQPERWAKLRKVYEDASDSSLRDARDEIIRQRLESGKQVTLLLPDRDDPRWQVGREFEAKSILTIPKPEASRDRRGFPYQLYELSLPAPTTAPTEAR
jgi:hypothetical protein